MNVFVMQMKSRMPLLADTASGQTLSEPNNRKELNNG